MSIKVVVVEDDLELQQAIAKTLSLAGFLVSACESVTSACSTILKEKPHIVVSDVQLGEETGDDVLKFCNQADNPTPVIFMTAFGTVTHAVQSVRKGVLDYLQKPFSPEVLVNLVMRYAKTEAPADSVVAVDSESLKLFSKAKKIAQTMGTVLLLGESGTGKEVMARFIHDQGNTAGDFVAVNCAAIPENMLESTLFGFEKGAFTGAHKAMPGKFEQAEGGTLFLDEISEMPLGLQAKLLRVLQEREVERLGGQTVRKVNVRVIASSNRDMQASIQNGEFREDLFYRLNVLPLTCIPLRERRADIVPLATRFIQRFCNDNHQPIVKMTPAAEKALEAAAWPGNVRELGNVIERAVVLQTEQKITAEDLSPWLKTTPVNDSNLSQSAGGELSDTVARHEFDAIHSTLKAHDGKRKQTAEALGISERTLRYKLAKMREAGVAV